MLHVTLSSLQPYICKLDHEKASASKPMKQWVPTQLSFQNVKETPQYKHARPGTLACVHAVAGKFLIIKCPTTLFTGDYHCMYLV